MLARLKLQPMNLEANKQEIEKLKADIDRDAAATLTRNIVCRGVVCAERRLSVIMFQRAVTLAELRAQARPNKFFV